MDIIIFDKLKLIDSTLSKYKTTIVSPFLVSTRFTCDDISRLGRESLSTVKPEGRLTSITAILLSFASLVGTNLTIKDLIINFEQIKPCKRRKSRK